jgi:urease accessory protein
MFTFSPALAHVPIEGWGDFANGAIHPALNPGHALLIIGLALLLGQRDPLKVKAPMLFFAPASALALALTATGWVGGNWPPVMMVLSLVLGSLVAIARHPRPLVIHSLCLAAAVLLGLDSEVEARDIPAAIQTLAGTWLALNLLLLYVTLASSNATGKPLPANAIRILGSWIVAISLLMLAFELRGSG